MNKILLSFCLLFTSFSLIGQGSIVGSVLDEDSGETLIAATVLVQGTDKGTTTDFDGKYQLNLDEGIYTLVFSYIGYSDKTVTDISVKDGETTYLDLSMKFGSSELIEEVVVTAKVIERSENSILLLQKRSDQIQDGISSQEMSRFSVGNAASAIKRVTGASVEGGKYVFIRGLGDRYSLSQLNDLIIPSTDPYRNSAPLDLIPSNLLENIITTKTFTPDQPGTFTGGNINIKTKSFPERFTFSASAGVSINSNSNFIDNFLSYKGGSNDVFGFDDGGRELPYILGGDYARKDTVLSTFIPQVLRLPVVGEDQRAEFANLADEAINSIASMDYDPVQKSTAFNHSVSLSGGNQFDYGNVKLGLILAGTYKKNFSHVEAAQRANWIRDASTELTGELFNQGSFQETTSDEKPFLSGFGGLALKIGNLNKISFQSLYNHLTTKRSRFILGERENILNPELLQARQLLWSERAIFNYVFSGEHVFASLNKAKIEWKFSQTSSQLDEPNTRFFENVYDTSDEGYAIPLSNVQDPFLYWRYLEDDKTDIKFDFTLPFGNKTQHKIKMGSLISQTDRVFTENRFQVKNNANSIPFNGNVTNYFDQSNTGVVRVDTSSAFGIQHNLGLFVIDDTQPENSYVGDENVSAFYAMTSLQLLDKLKVVGGVRLEKTDILVDSQDSTQVDSLRFGSIDDTDFLPSLGIIYSLSERTNLRANISKTLARPNMREKAPFGSYDPPLKSVYFGNVDLVNTQIYNYDLRFEYYIKPGELFAVSAFYKYFINPITLVFRPAPNPEFEYRNSNSGKVYGIELEIRKSLDFIAPQLSKFKFNGNVSIINSETDVEVVNPELDPETRRFFGQAPFIINTSLVYNLREEHGLEFALSYNYTGDRLAVIGNEGTPDSFNKGRSSMDLVATKTKGKFTLKAGISNLIDDPYILSSEFNGNEFIYSKFKRGRTYSFSIGYSI